MDARYTVKLERNRKRKGGGWGREKGKKREQGAGGGRREGGIEKRRDLPREVWNLSSYAL